jgi:hypothetical protein
MDDIEPKRFRVGSLQWSGKYSRDISWGSSLLLKLAFLATGVWFVDWVGWPQPSLFTMPQLENSGSLTSRTLHSGSADHPSQSEGETLGSGETVVHPHQERVREHEPPRELNGFAVDLNHGTLAELEHLPGIGPVLAGRIVAHRTLHGFRHIDDLSLVPGIGAKRLAQLRPLVGVRVSARPISVGN